jgi:hypothetical protein
MMQPDGAAPPRHAPRHPRRSATTLHIVGRLFHGGQACGYCGAHERVIIHARRVHLGNECSRCGLLRARLITHSRFMRPRLYRHWRVDRRAAGVWSWT